MAKRREKTLADYVVIAISPALIMTLVGSLAFFLLEVSYRGQFETRLQWVLFWFVFAAVLVARMAIDQGTERAALFGLAMMGVTGLFAYRFIDQVVVAWVLLAVIWFCSWKLTWDCTLIDESEDSSGEGLLQAAGLGGAKPPDEASGNPPPRAESAAPKEDAPPLWQRLIGSADERRRRPHAPGMWVVYFSLAALPLFGVGQLFIPAARINGRSYGFLLLAVYVGSALGLLLTTSFLGLRRYLRQRKLQMPATMAVTWIGMGTGLALVLLLLALLIPRPQGGEYTLTAMVDKIDARAREASRQAVLRDERRAEEARRAAEQERKAEQKKNEQKGRPLDDKQGQKKVQQDQLAQADARAKGDAQANAKEDGGAKPARPSDGDAKDQPKADTKPEAGGRREPTGDAPAKADAKAGTKTDAKNESGQQPEGDGKNQPKADDQGEPKPPQKPDPDAEKARPGKPPQKDEKPAAKQPEKRNQPDKKAGPDANKPTPPTPPTSTTTSLMASLAPYVKWMIYGVMGAAAIFVAIRHWSRLVAILAQLWADFLSLFGFGPGSAAGGAADEQGTMETERLPFSAYEDPFVTGAARQMTPAELVVYTFEALEAWGREQVIERPPEQTPLEFAQELGRRQPAAAKDFSATAELYVQVAYARKNPPKEGVEIIERMWRRMRVASGV